MNAAESTPSVHGDERTPPTRPQDANEPPESLAKRLSRFGSSGYIRVYDKSTGAVRGSVSGGGNATK